MSRSLEKQSTRTLDKDQLNQALFSGIDNLIGTYAPKITDSQQEHIRQHGLQLYWRGNLDHKSAQEILLVIEPKKSKDDESGYPVGSLTDWKQNGGYVHYDVYKNGVRGTNQSSMIEVHPTDWSHNGLSQLGEPSLVKRFRTFMQGKPQHNGPTLYKLIHENDNLIPLVQLAKIIEEGQPDKTGYQPIVKRSLLAVDWNSLEDKDDRKAIIQSRIKALKALGEKSLLQWQVLNEMKNRYLIKNEPEALVRSPFTRIILGALTPYQFFVLFENELQSGRFPQKWLNDQYIKLTHGIDRNFNLKQADIEDYRQARELIEPLLSS